MSWFQPATGLPSREREDRHDSMLNILILSTYLSSLLSSLASFSALESSTQCLGVRSHWDSSKSQTIPSSRASSTTHQLWDLRQALSLLSFGFPVCKTGIVTNCITLDLCGDQGRRLAEKTS